MPYSILKVLKQNNQTRWLHLVLYPTAFSRFSNRIASLLRIIRFCTLHHFQGSQTMAALLPSMTSFVPYSIFKVLKQDEQIASDDYVLCPTAFSRFSNLQKNLNAYSTPNKPSCFLSTKPYSYELYRTKTFWSISVSYKYSELHFSKKSPRPPIPFW